MWVISFITEYAVVDRIIDHLNLTIAVAKPQPPHVFAQVVLAAALVITGSGESIVF